MKINKEDEHAAPAAEAEGKLERIVTVPNLMSLFRLLLIPLIVWVYLKLQKYWLVAALLLLSGATDVADGFVARHFNQVSNLGKMLDPVADKLTEGVLMILLALRHPLLWAVVAVFAVGAFLPPLPCCCGRISRRRQRTSSSRSAASWSRATSRHTACFI